MDTNKVAKAIALAVKKCGCIHCQNLITHALGDELQEEFWRKYKWSGK